MEEPSSSSKVTVEYFDPYGVYQLLSPGLLPRLPLRNLHWESHAGPLRSISSLHVDLVPAVQESHLSADFSTASPSDLSRVKSSDSTASGDDGFRTQVLGQATVEKSSSSARPAVKERRHQIPGLRSTPYLKIFLLRCDDTEEYKAQARKQIREWIKEHTPSSSAKTNSQENHDAFEWMIVHVIVPNTAAATQPRISGKTVEGSSGSTTEKARWRGTGSSTILEKLKADFNGSSKSAIDRIAQIRIGINDVPYEMLPRVVPAIPGSYSETPQENEIAWVDLISKLKALILASFDMRVSQYEEDIREKDSQRSLPGWNFCTFFVLKEGLARGFESVGLVEDALVGYDELAVGLDSIIREQAAGGSRAQHGGSFLPYTEDLRRQAEKAKAAVLKDAGAEEITEEPIDLQSTNVSDQADEIPLNASKKRYRELILSNDVSVFDFRCYLFGRQLSLLLRLANASSSQAELLAKLKEQRESSLQGVAARLPAVQPSEDTENLAVLGEVCRRSLDFVASIARIMRDDIWASFLQNALTIAEKTELESNPNPLLIQIIDNIVCSFTFAVAQQILAQTSTKSLPIPPSTLAPPGTTIGLDGHEPKASIPEPKTMMHPARSSSLAVRSSSREPSDERRSSLPDPGATSTPFLKTGLEELAAHRAELYLLSRNVLEHVGNERGWYTGWKEISRQHSSDMEDMEDVNLNEEPQEREHEDTSTKEIAPILHGINSKLLRTALDNQDDFYRLYETLTDKALRHYTVANRIHSVQTSMADLAVLKYHLSDYAAAASYFYQITRAHGESGWAQIELSMLVMHSKCLKELQRRDEYVRVVLKLLEKAANIQREVLARKFTPRQGSSSKFDREDPIPTGAYLNELLHITKTLPRAFHVPLGSFFSRVEVDSTPQYHPEKDSFGLRLRLQYLLQEDLHIENARVKIVGINTGRELWLEMEGETVFEHGTVKLQVESNATTPDTYQVSHIILNTNNIALEYAHEVTGASTSKGNAFFKSPKLLIYHRENAFDVKLVGSRSIHLDRNRALEIELSSGWNDVTSGELYIRPATAGLRLQTSEAKVAEGSLDISKKSHAGAIRFNSMKTNSVIKLRVPFSLEQEVNDLSLKLEVLYTTEKGEFSIALNPTTSIMLPLGVNVQDVFKHNALFSKFTISSATDGPLQLLGTKLAGSKAFNAECGITITRPLTIFPRQPADFLYKITQLSPVPSSLSQSSKKDSKTALSLVVHYICLEEEIDNSVCQELRKVFKNTPLQPFARLIVPTVLAELQAHLTPYELERIAILKEITTSLISDVKWHHHFSGLGYSVKGNQDTASIIAQNIQDWQQRTPTIPLIPLSLDAEAIANSRSVIIPVEVPSVTVVHTADLHLLTTLPISSDTPVAAFNQAISASLNIKWTRIWDSPAPDSAAPSGDLDFVYEVVGATDTWLIGGRRKGHFKASRSPEGKKNRLKFPVVLIPLREGFLPYPSVEIKPASAVRSTRPGTANGDDDVSRKAPLITCETDYKNSGEIIRVISDARKTTVSLDASGPGGGAWLLETERRTVV